MRAAKRAKTKAERVMMRALLSVDMVM
jgi:hypothetical protein